jgi:hypothetical protein
LPKSLEIVIGADTGNSKIQVTPNPDQGEPHRTKALTRDAVDTRLKVKEWDEDIVE